MKLKIMAGCLAWSLLAGLIKAEDGKPQSSIAAEEPLSAEAQAAVDELRQQLPEDSEAKAMLDKILAGSRLGPEDGWFPLAKSQTRFDWNYILKSYDSDSDKTIKQAEFTETEEDFGRIDRNGDGQITDADLDWSEHSLMAKPGFLMFLMADRNANGKLTKEEFTTLYETLGAGKDGFLALDDVRDQFVPASTNNPKDRLDRPSRSTLVMGLKNQEVGSLQPGPKLDDPAPDFTLDTIAGKPVTLSEEIGEKPIVLIFGNFTCGPFRSQAGNLEKFYKRYRDRAKIFLVYVREAHPADGWWMTSNQQAGIELLQPKDNAARLKAAVTCQQHLDLDIPILVDDVDDRVGAMYSGMPNRLYLIDKEGKIAFKNGRGPFGFHPRQLEQSLILLLNE